MYRNSMFDNPTLISVIILKVLHAFNDRPIYKSNIDLVWNPHLAKDFHCIEMVQNICRENMRKNYSECYETLLDLCQIPSQQVIFIIMHFL